MNQKPLIRFGLDNFRDDSDEEEKHQQPPKKNPFIDNLNILRVETHVDLATPSAQKICKFHPETF